MKRVFLNTKIKISVLLFLGAFTLFFSAHGQTAPISFDNPFLTVAPHLPKMVRYDGVGKKFHGEKYIYKKEENETALKVWSEKYPGEVGSYKDTAVKYFASISVNTLSPTDQELFFDLKSQWLMVLQNN